MCIRDRYKRSYEGEGATPETGVKRLQPFFDWLKEHDAQGFIGEFGVPDDDARWLVVLDNALAAMKEQGVGGTYWAAGPWWNNYPLSVEPKFGVDRPQMAVLAYYTGAADSSKEKPWIAAAAAAEARARAIEKLDERLGRRVYDFRQSKESYHYANDGSKFASEDGAYADEPKRKIAFEHVGDPAWIGLGMYFGKIDCSKGDAFNLEIAADKPCKLEVKVYETGGRRYTAKFDIGAKEQRLVIPFAELTVEGESYNGAKPIEKIELQPSPSDNGNALYLGAFRLKPTDD